jgi:hypothetical protein
MRVISFTLRPLYTLANNTRYALGMAVNRIIFASAGNRTPVAEPINSQEVSSSNLGPKTGYHKIFVFPQSLQVNDGRVT